MVGAEGSIASLFTTPSDMTAASKKGSSSAGIGNPYWYEWGIGLLKAVEMLNPDSGIEAVAFQKDGMKGWDDVVVRYRSGHHDYYQVKYSQPRTNLTFSDLVGKSGDQPSLLSSLTSSWHEMKLGGADSSCILLTNRSAGTTGSPVHRLSSDPDQGNRSAFRAGSRRCID